MDWPTAFYHVGEDFAGVLFILVMMYFLFRD